MKVQIHQKTSLQILMAPNTANPIQENAIKGIEELNITQQQQMTTQTPSSSASSSSFSPSTMLAQESEGKSMSEQPIQEEEDDDGDNDVLKGIGDLNITHTPSSSSSSSPPILLVLANKGKSIAEKFIQEDVIKGIEDLNIAQQKDDDIVMTDDEDWHPFRAFKKRKCLPNLLIQEDGRIGKEFKIETIKKAQLLIRSSSCHGDAPTSVPTAPASGQESPSKCMEDWHPFRAFKKRKCLPNLLIQEDGRIGKEFKIETIKKAQLLIRSSSCHGDAPTSVPTAPASGQESDGQVEEDQHQESPRNTANLRGKSRLSRFKDGSF